MKRLKSWLTLVKNPLSVVNGVGLKPLSEVSLPLRLLLLLALLSVYAMVFASTKSTFKTIWILETRATVAQHQTAQSLHESRKNLKQDKNASGRKSEGISNRVSTRLQATD